MLNAQGVTRKAHTVKAADAEPKDDDKWLDEPVKRFRADILAGYQREQEELEARGSWKDADVLNSWLAGLGECPRKLEMRPV